MAAPGATAADEPTAVTPSEPTSATARGAEVSWTTRWFSLESTWATRVYWTALCLLALALFVPRLLPLVDYPQHLGMAEILRRLSDAAAPQHAGFKADYHTYNALFHWLVAHLGQVMPVELAGRIVVASALVGLGAALVALLAALERPRWLAALFVPAIFSMAVCWGFINHALGIALGVTTLVFVSRALRRPNLVSWLATLALGCLLGFAHVLALALLCLLAVSFAPELSWRATAERLGQAASKPRRALLALWHSFCALSPLLGGGLYCIDVYRMQYARAPDTYEDPVLEGSMPPIWEKLALFPRFTLGNHGDYTDVVLLCLSLAAFVWIGIDARRHRGERSLQPSWGGPIYLPLLATFATYLWIPMVFFGTHMIFPRLGQLVVLGWLLALPAPSARLTARLQRPALGLALAAGLNLVVHCAWFAYETNDASRVNDAIPPGRRVTSVVYDQSTLSFARSSLVHLAAYYAPRHRDGGGDYAFNFARYQSVPLAFRPGSQPAWPRRGWEFIAADYNPRCKYARTYDVVIAGAPRDMADADEAAVRAWFFGQDAAAVRLLARSGRFWAFDTQGLPSDGTL